MTVLPLGPVDISTLRRGPDRRAEPSGPGGRDLRLFPVAALRRSGAPYRRTAGELAQISLVTTGGITLRLDRLETAGLVARERDPDDRRVVYARLTDEGLEVVEKVAEAHFANESRMLAGLSENERRQLGRLLSKLERSLEQAERTAP